jgi:hypothetical protein
MHNDETTPTPDNRGQGGLIQHWSDYLVSLVIASARKFEIDEACEQPRIASLRQEVVALEANDDQRLSLLQAIDAYRETFTTGRFAHLWCYHRDGSKTYDEVSDLEWLINHLPGMGGELAMNRIGKDCSTPDTGLHPSRIKENEMKPGTIWHHPTLGLVKFVRTIVGSGNAKVKTLTGGELNGVGFNEAGNIYYVPRDQLSAS